MHAIIKLSLLAAAVIAAPQQKAARQVDFPAGFPFQNGNPFDNPDFPFTKGNNPASMTTTARATTTTTRSAMTTTTGLPGLPTCSRTITVPGTTITGVTIPPYVTIPASSIPAKTVVVPALCTGAAVAPAVDNGNVVTDLIEGLTAGLTGQ